MILCTLFPAECADTVFVRVVSVHLVADCVMEAVSGPSRQAMPVFVTGSFPVVGLKCWALEEVWVNLCCFLMPFLRVFLECRGLWQVVFLRQLLCQQRGVGEDVD